MGQRLVQFRRGAAVAVGLIGVLGLVGWRAGIEALTRVVPGLPPLPPASAALILFGAAGLVARPRLARALGVGIALAGLGLLALRAARPVVVTALPGPLPQPAALWTAICGGLALVLRDARAKGWVWLMQCLLLVGMLYALQALVSFIPFEREPLLGPTSSAISLLGAVATILFGLGLLFSRPEAGLVALLVSERPGGRLLRLLTAAGIAGPLAATVGTQLAWKTGLFGVGAGLSLVILGNVLVFYWVASAYDRADQARRAAEKRLAQTNAELERRVAERTAALADREAQISAIGDNLPGAMIYQTVAAAGQPSRFSYVSAGVERISGFSVDSVLADISLLYRQIAAEDRHRLRRAERESGRLLTPLDVVVRKQTPWGWRWSRIRARPRRLDERRIAWDGMEVDITEQKAFEATLERDQRYQAALFACSQALLEAVPTAAERQAALAAALGHLLAAANADRVFLMGMAEPPDGEPYVVLEAEICSAGIAPALMTPEPLRIPASMVAPLVVETDDALQPIAGTIEQLAERSPAFAELVAGLGVRSLIVLPLRLASGQWRAIGFHDCSTPRIWDDQEILLLRTASELISSALVRWAGEDELRRREELLATIFDLLPVGLAVTDARGTPLRTNRAILHIAGLNAEQAMTGEYLQLPYFRPDGQPLTLGEFPIIRAMSGEVVRDLEVRLVRPDGAERWVSVSAAPLPIPGMGGVLVAVDVTARRRAEEERLRFERKLLEGQRLESLGVLAGGMAHDFNNILTAMLGHAELARLDVAPAGEAAASLDAIILGARRAADLTGQMLAYAGRSHVNSAAVDLNEVVVELVELTRATLPAGASVHVCLTEQLPPVQADDTQVRQVLLNLLTNAGEALAAGVSAGAISVVSGCCELTAEQAAAAAVAGVPGRYGYLEVCDNGVGIDRETLARIFDPFFTTKFTGRGLGLAAVQGIVRAHKGALFVSSAPGQGACFRVCFPVVYHRDAESTET